MDNKKFVIDSRSDFSSAFDPALQAITAMCPVSVTPAFLQGMTGGSALRSGIPPLASDVTHWLVPGLKWCGIQAELLALPQTAADGLALLQPQLRRSQGVPVFAFSAPLEYNKYSGAEPPIANQIENLIENSVEEANENLASNLKDKSIKKAYVMAAIEPDPGITQQGLVTQAARSHVTIREADGTFRTCTYMEFKADFSHLLLLRKSTQRGVKAIHREAAIRTWALFAHAYPERFLNAGKNTSSKEGTHSRLLLAADFWRQLAGSDRSAASHSLRRLAASLENARTRQDIQTIADSLALLTRPQFLLSPFIENALSAPAHSVLSDSERRELIYLARAGTRDLKIFAAYRLRFERECADARSTLQQMRFDSDAWVRAAARL